MHVRPPWHSWCAVVPDLSVVRSDLRSGYRQVAGVGGVLLPLVDRFREGLPSAARDMRRRDGNPPQSLCSSGSSWTSIPRGEVHITRVGRKEPSAFLLSCDGVDAAGRCCSQIRRRARLKVVQSRNSEHHIIPNPSKSKACNDTIELVKIGLGSERSEPRSSLVEVYGPKSATGRRPNGKHSQERLKGR